MGGDVEAPPKAGTEGGIYGLRRIHRAPFHTPPLYITH